MPLPAGSWVKMMWPSPKARWPPQMPFLPHAQELTELTPSFGPRLPTNGNVDDMRLFHSLSNRLPHKGSCANETFESLLRSALKFVSQKTFLVGLYALKS